MTGFKKWFSEVMIPRENKGENIYKGDCGLAWKEALKWARVKLENYTIDDVLYFIDEELEE